MARCAIAACKHGERRTLPAAPMKKAAGGHDQLRANIGGGKIYSSGSSLPCCCCWLSICGFG
jgi:hypothetical protein